MADVSSVRAAGILECVTIPMLFIAFKIKEGHCDLCSLPCQVTYGVVRPCFPLNHGLYLTRTGCMSAIDTEPPWI